MRGVERHTKKKKENHLTFFIFFHTVISYQVFLTNTNNLNNVV